MPTTYNLSLVLSILGSTSVGIVFALAFSYVPASFIVYLVKEKED